MTYDPYKIIPAILVVLCQGNKVLLARRQNTSYMDGWYGLPGGHLEDNETLQEGAAREVKEETGLIVDPAELELFHIYQNKNTPGRQYIGFMFRSKKWKGDAGLMEHKADDIQFFSIDNLPQKTIPYHLEAVLSRNDPAIKITFIPLEAFDPSGKSKS